MSLQEIYYNYDTRTKKIIREYQSATSKGLKCVLATVVALDGSSYRRPGVRMLILEDGHMIGAVSGGCVEKEVVRQAQSVFADDISKVMTYDGRYRLGCEGILYILLEAFRPDKVFLETFELTIASRHHFRIQSFLKKKKAPMPITALRLYLARMNCPYYQGSITKRSLRYLSKA